MGIATERAGGTRRENRAIQNSPTAGRGRLRRGLHGRADRAGRPPRGAEDHQGGHGHAAGHRPLRGRAAGPGDDGPSEHRQGARRRRDRDGPALLRHGTGPRRADHRLLRPATSARPRSGWSCFIHVCQAVQHAHQKGIIHRDIKPINVLVTVADGKPRAEGHRLRHRQGDRPAADRANALHREQQIIGTPEYMSPEQAECPDLDIDTRSDIYSLGVLLYELLVGEPPFAGRRLRSAPFAEMQRIIRDEEPPRPSLRMRTLSGSSSEVRIQTVGKLERAARRSTSPGAGGPSRSCWRSRCAAISTGS